MAESIFNFIGGSVCHQLAERTISVNGILLPVCARCTGIYTAVFVSLLLLIITQGIRGNKPLSLMQAVIAAASTLPLMADGFFSYAGLWQTNNFIRVSTGALCGWIIPVIVALVFNFNADGVNNRPVLQGKAGEAAFIFTAIAISWLIYAGAGIYYISAAVISTGVLIVFTSFFALIMRLVFAKASGRSIFMAAAPIGCAAMAVASLVFSHLRGVLISP